MVVPWLQLYRDSQGQAHWLLVLFVTQACDKKGLWEPGIWTTMQKPKHAVRQLRVKEELWTNSPGGKSGLAEKPWLEDLYLEVCPRGRSGTKPEAKAWSQKTLLTPLMLHLNAAVAPELTLIYWVDTLLWQGALDPGADQRVRQAQTQSHRGRHF